MDILKYDFESLLEQGFKDLFDTEGLTLLTAEDVDSEISDESIILQIETGGPGSDEHMNPTGEYDIYNGAIEIEIRTLRNSLIGPTNPAFNSRQAELTAIARKLLEEIDETKLLTTWPGSLSPTKIVPSNSQREVDFQYKITTLNYDFQFRIA